MRTPNSIRSFILRPLAAGAQVWSGPVTVSFINENIVESNAGDGTYIEADHSADDGKAQTWTLDWADQPITGFTSNPTAIKCKRITKIIIWAYHRARQSATNVGVGGSVTIAGTIIVGNTQFPTLTTSFAWGNVALVPSVAAQRQLMVFFNLLSSYGVSAPVVTLTPSFGKSATGDYDVDVLYVEIFGDAS